MKREFKAAPVKGGSLFHFLDKFWAMSEAGTWQ